jgi:hypothetical protein
MEKRVETRGNKKGCKRAPYKRYTDEEIIEVISKYETIKELRESDDMTFYFRARRRGLEDFLPVRRTKAMNIVGSSLERRIKKKEEMLLIKEEKKRLREENKSEREKRSEVVDSTIASKLYKVIEIDGKTLCGRCLEADLSTSYSSVNKNLCKKCYAKYLYLRGQGRDTNPHNVKDDYCNMRITHYEKVFEIGIKTDQRLQDYLSMVGYEFIFKDVQD